MEINDIQGKRVKISAQTITVKNDAGKTCGMVRGVRPMRSFSNRERFDAWRALQESGLWKAVNSGLAEHDTVIFDGNSLYYLNNLSPLKLHEYHIEEYKRANNTEDISFFADDIERYNLRKQLVKDCISAGITVIDCYVL